MAFLDTLALNLAPAIAGPLFSAWSRRRGKTPENTRTLRQLIASATRTGRAIPKLEREVGWLAEEIANSLEPIFKVDGASLTEHGRDAVVIGLANTIQSQGLNPPLLVQANLDPIVVYQHYKECSPPFTTGLNEKELAFFHACLLELCHRLIDIATKLPNFDTVFIRQILEASSELHDRGKFILSSLEEFVKNNRTKEVFVQDNFKLRYAAAMRRKFGRMDIFGLDTSVSAKPMSIDISYISLSATPTYGVPDDDPDNIGRSFANLKAEHILRRSRRALIRGQAGSGKTTLLQWLAIQIVERRLRGDLAFLNNYTPIFIRLRDHFDRQLPTDKDLVAAVSPALLSIMPPKWLPEVLSTDRAIFLIDGLDEVSSSQRDDVREWIEDLVGTSPDSIFLVTTRPTSVERNYLHDVGFDEYVLNRMSPRELSEFIQYWHAALLDAAGEDERTNISVRQRALIALLDENRLLHRMGTNPLIAAIICTLNFKDKLRVIGGRAQLYRTAFQLLAHDRDILRGVQDRIYDGLALDVKERVLSEIAYWLVKADVLSCSRVEVGRIVFRLLGEEGLKARGASTEEVVQALVVRSGVLREITPDSVQFIHKTFQEYLSALAVVWHGDEGYVARKFDLRQWNELVIMVASLTSKQRAEEMLDHLIARGDNEADGPYYDLLAAACLRGAFQLPEDLSSRISQRLSLLIPPRDRTTSALLAGANELVLPLLHPKPEYTEGDIRNVVATLSEIDTAEARKLINRYTEEVALSDAVIDQLLDAATYSRDAEFMVTLLGGLCARESELFYPSTQKGILRLASSKLPHWSRDLPQVKHLQLDCYADSGLLELLRYGGLSEQTVQRVDILNVYGALALDTIFGLQDVSEVIIANVAELNDVSGIADLKHVDKIVFLNVDQNRAFPDLRVAELSDGLYVNSVARGDMPDFIELLRAAAFHVFVSQNAFEALHNEVEVGDQEWGIEESHVMIWDEEEIESLITSLLEA